MQVQGKWHAEVRQVSSALTLFRLQHFCFRQLMVMVTVAFVGATIVAMADIVVPPP